MEISTKNITMTMCVFTLVATRLNNTEPLYHEPGTTISCKMLTIV